VAKSVLGGIELAEQKEQDKSIPQQVIDNTLAKLEGKAEFPEAVISKLKELAAKGSLDSQKAIIQAISISQEDNHASNGT
jgi:hypothetical protein